jgi:teichoic acid transport system ATP-binding protein
MFYRSDNMSNVVAIEFENVTKEYKLYKDDRARLLAVFFGKLIKYKKKRANDSLSFKIKRGESIAILGRNGAGKSTMLKMITGVVFPTKGKIVVNGRVSALLELTAGFDPEFTGRENIHLKAHLMGLNNDQIKKLEPDIIRFAELDIYIDQPVRTYSSGMKARLGFAINVNIEPEILVIDEALSVGDIKFQEKCRVKIEEIMKQDTVTVLFVTHSIESAASICQKGMVLADGKLIYYGKIDKAAAKYEKILK